MAFEIKMPQLGLTMEVAETGRRHRSKRRCASGNYNR